MQTNQRTFIWLINNSRAMLPAGGLAIFMTLLFHRTRHHLQ